MYRDGLYYKKFSDIPFTGKTTGRSQTSFKNGKFHGPCVHFHKNGQLKEKGTYKDDKKNGQWIDYDKSGKKKYGPYNSGMYKNGKKVSD